MREGELGVSGHDEHDLLIRQWNMRRLVHESELGGGGWANKQIADFTEEWEAGGLA